MTDREKAAAAGRYLDAIPRFSRKKHALEDLRRMADCLDAAPSCPVVHVAGTNGKGSVCAFLDSILRTAGYRTGRFTSPHLVSVRERFSFDGCEVDEAGFVRAFEAVRERVTAFPGAEHPTYFEFLFLMFLVMARERRPDYLILETGLGGRLDATNSVEKTALSVITSISRDHMEYLGDSIPQIAAEKAGIIRAGTPVIYDRTDPEAAAVIGGRAAALQSPACPVGPEDFTGLSVSDGALYLTMRDGAGDQPLKVPFAASYQAVNAALAYRAARMLGVEPAAAAEGIARTVWPGRMERLAPGIYLDGAHNEGGIRAFAGAARRIAGAAGGRTLLLFGVSSDKEYRGMLGILEQILRPDELFLTRAQSDRGLETDRLLETAREVCAGRTARRDGAGQEDGAGQAVPVRAFESAARAFAAAAAEKKEEDVLFCAGSLYLAGEIRDYFRRNEDERRGNDDPV